MRGEQYNLKNENLLIDNLTALIKKYGRKSDFYDKVEQKLTDKMYPSKIVDIFYGDISIKTISDEEKYLIAQAMYEVLQIKDIDPELYFEPMEKHMAQMIFTNVKFDIQNYIVLPNVDMVGENEFVCSSLSFQEIKKSYDMGLVYVNPETQRESETKIVLGEVIKQPKIYDDSVEEIFNKISNKKFFSNTLTWNILKTGGEQFEYNAKDRTLTIWRSETSVINLIDGQHRTLGLIKALTKQPNLKGFFTIKIFNLTARGAQEYIAQENKGHKISEDRIKAFESNKFMSIARDVNSYENEEINSLYNKIAEQKDDLIISNKYTLLSTFAEGVEKYYSDDLRLPKDLSKVKRWLVDFFNELTGEMCELFEDVNTSRKNTFAFEALIWISYMYISRKLYNVDNWESKLSQIIKNINFDRGNEDWKEIKPSANLTNANIKRIEKYIDRKIKEAF